MSVKTSIAVVEDNKDNRLLLRAMLEESYKVSEFETAFQALHAFKGSRPDLIVMDISLPGMDGREFLSALRADETLKRIPVIALTAHAMSGDREQYLAAGFDEYLPKPIVDEEDLFNAIERLLKA